MCAQKPSGREQAKRIARSILMKHKTLESFAKKNAP